MIDRKIIDSHGHFGRSFLGPESPIKPYAVEAGRIGVVATVASPGPAPEIVQGTKIVRPCMWKVENGQVSYVSQEIHPESRVTEGESSLNPYHEVNAKLLDMAQKHNQTEALRIMVMPIHHPILDTEPEVLSMVSDPRSVALKVHGIATFTGPRDISQTTIDILKKSDKPLVVHTDMYRNEVAGNIHIAYQLNDPVDWAEWGRDTGVKTLITHGARLSPEAISIVKASPNLMIGISPDLLLVDEPERLHHDTDDFLAELLENVPSEKLLFDIDYGWNVTERNQWDKQDWDMCNRIDLAAGKINLPQNSLDKIYFDNAMKFYNI